MSCDESIERVDLFINRKIKAKKVFDIRMVTKSDAYNFTKEHHYLGNSKFISTYAYGLFLCDEMIGCAVYSSPQGISTLKGWFGVDNKDVSIQELVRLTLIPELNGTNATSYLLGNSIKMLKKEGVRAVLTLADSRYHVGSIYQVCNFKYYGLTDKKPDFYRSDGKVNPRGKTKDVKGVWINRSRKHRYCYIIDNELECLYDQKSYPKKGDTIELDCCGGEEFVYDRRFDEFYTCPICTGELKVV